MWNKNKSLFLSRILTAVAAGLFFLTLFFIPSIAQWYEDFSDTIGLLSSKSVVIPMCIGLYIVEAMAFICLWSLHVLLRNISRNKVFIPENTSCLRRISWTLMLAGAAFAGIGIWRSICLFPAVCVVMLGLVIRVLKNVFEEAVEIKSENDFTI